MAFLQLSDLEAIEMLPGFTARLVHTNQVTVAYIDIVAGSVAPEHSHPHGQVTTVIAGELELTINGETELLIPGTVAVIPPEARHGARAKTACRIMDYFCPTRDDLR